MMLSITHLRSRTHKLMEDPMLKALPPNEIDCARQTRCLCLNPGYTWIYQAKIWLISMHMKGLTKLNGLLKLKNLPQEPHLERV